MKRITIFILFCLVILVLSSSVMAKNNQKIKIEFPELKTNSLNLSLTPLQATPQFIHFKIKNPKHKKLKVKVNLKGTNSEYIDYQLYDSHPANNREHIVTQKIVANPFQTSKKVYNAWLEIDFKKLNSKWWQVEAGNYSYQVVFTVTSIN